MHVYEYVIHVWNYYKNTTHTPTLLYDTLLLGGHDKIVSLRAVVVHQIFHENASCFFQTAKKLL